MKYRAAWANFVKEVTQWACLEKLDINSGGFDVV
jgi:hypothetical protein